MSDDAPPPAADDGPRRQAPPDLEGLERHLCSAFEELTGQVQYGELTLFCPARRLVEVMEFCRDDDALSCELLADLGAVHWPAGEEIVERQPSTTGWPDYRVSRERGVIEVSYILRSITHNHHFRISVGADDQDPVLPSVTSVYPTANFHEREVWDFFGVVFEDHPNLTRILMPEDWVGHPLRKDYPLGGVDIPYENDKFIPSPEDRDLREEVAE